MPHQGWEVSVEGVQIDVVYADADMDADRVRESLINHDGYSSAITIRRYPEHQGSENGMAAGVTIETFNGWEITLNTDDGRFTARLPSNVAYRQDQVITRKDLASIKREIASRTKGAVKLMSAAALIVNTRPQYQGGGEELPKCPSYPRQTAVVTITAVTSDGKMRDDSGGIVPHWHGFVKANLAVIERMEEFIRRRQAALDAIDQEYGEWAKTLGLRKLTIDEIKELLVAQQDAAEPEGSTA